MVLTSILLIGFLRWEKRDIAKIGFESFLVMVLYVTSFALLALSG
jgi:hypothetical protein